MSPLENFTLLYRLKVDLIVRKLHGRGLRRTIRDMVDAEFEKRGQCEKAKKTKTLSP